MLGRRFIRITSSSSSAFARDSSITTTMWFATVFLLGVLWTASAEDSDPVPDGSITVSPSIVNLDSNISFYTVSCTIEPSWLEAGVNSTHLSIRTGNRVIESKIVNESAIAAVVQLQGASALNDSDVCGIRRHGCYWKHVGLDLQTVVVGRPPATIGPERFKCISENRHYLRCVFPSLRNCDLDTEYALFMRNAMGGDTRCSLHPDGDLLQFDSRDEECLYLAGREKVSFRLEVTNGFGQKEMQFEVNNYDVVRPAPVTSLDVTNVTCASADVRWDKMSTLEGLDRRLRYEFRLVSEHRKNTTVSKDSPHILYDYSLANLYPHTEYQLMVRAQIVPEAPRLYDEEYWSEWTLVSFRTDACRPIHVPDAIPGAYSLKQIGDNLLSIDVYWQHLPMHARNGPGFGYNVSAISDSGDRYFPVVKANSTTPEVAHFPKMKMAHYRIELSCYNSEGTAISPPSVMEVYPPEPDRHPHIRKVLNFNGLLHLEWLPPSSQADLLNYTVMYCKPAASGICQDSIRLETVPKSQDWFYVQSNLPLNFALAANYRNYSSSLTWSQCVVSSDSTEVTPPWYYFADVTDRSFRVRFGSSCAERSFYVRYEVYVWTMNDVLIFNTTLEPYHTSVLVEGLSSDTQYLVHVLAVDEYGEQHPTPEMIRTTQKANAYIIALFMVCGMMVLTCVLAMTTQKLKKVVNIKVEIPTGLMWMNENLFVNETTIDVVESVLNAKDEELCGIKQYECFLKQSSLGIISVPIGRRPSTIRDSDFQCISYNAQRKKCQFTPRNRCNLDANYTMSIDRFGKMKRCNLTQKNDGSFTYDSDSYENCHFPDNEQVSVLIETRNEISRSTSWIAVHGIDIIKPDPVIELKVLDNKLTNTSAFADWYQKDTLKYLHRDFEYEFRIISEHGNKSSMKLRKNELISNYTIQDLIPYTNYELSVRLRMIPNLPRLFEEKYWSDWTTHRFRTVACRPNHVPVTFPGAYSIKYKAGLKLKLDVYWLPVEKHLWNGPGFEYSISATSTSGRTYRRNTNETVATFDIVEIDYYTVLISCHNSEGSAGVSNILKVYPPNPARQPTIKRILNTGDFELSWFPPAEQRNLLSYTIMYCDLTVSDQCQHSIRLLTKSPSSTSLTIATGTILNFAISANYHNFSSAFDWHECYVNPETTVERPDFEVYNKSAESFYIRLNATCESRSFYERITVLVNSTTKQELLFNQSLLPSEDTIVVAKLEANTEYRVQLIAYDDSEEYFSRIEIVSTMSRFNFYQILALFTIGMLVTSVLVLSATRKVRRIMAIEVEIPAGLVKIDELPRTKSSEELLLKSHPKIYDEHDLPPAILIIPEEEEVESLMISEVLFDPGEAARTEREEVVPVDAAPGAGNGYVLAAQFLIPRTDASPSNDRKSNDEPRIRPAAAAIEVKIPAGLVKIDELPRTKSSEELLLKSHPKVYDEHDLPTAILIIPEEEEVESLMVSEVLFDPGEAARMEREEVVPVDAASGAGNGYVLAAQFLIPRADTSPSNDRKPNDEPRIRPAAAAIEVGIPAGLVKIDELPRTKSSEELLLKSHPKVYDEHDLPPAILIIPEEEAVESLMISEVLFDPGEAARTEREEVVPVDAVSGAGNGYVLAAQFLIPRADTSPSNDRKSNDEPRIRPAAATPGYVLIN